jgi:hypothetical protein
MHFTANEDPFIIGDILPQPRSDIHGDLSGVNHAGVTGQDDDPWRLV